MIRQTDAWVLLVLTQTIFVGRVRRKIFMIPLPKDAVSGCARLMLIGVPRRDEKNAIKAVAAQTPRTA